MQPWPFDRSSPQFLNRPLPAKQSCTEQAPPHAPDAIRKDDVEVNDFRIDPNNRLYLNFTWELPDATYGQVKGYEVRVLHMPVSSNVDPTSSNIITKKEFTSVS